MCISGRYGMSFCESLVLKNLQKIARHTSALLPHKAMPLASASTSISVDPDMVLDEILDVESS
jgi:hypothetical protein